MRRMRAAAAMTVLVVCGLIGLAISSAGNPSAASAQAAAAPSATTSSASNVAQSSATVSGTVNPNGTATNYYFQYGTTTAYGSTTPSTAAGAGTANVSESANLTGLTSSTTYHYRIVAVNSAGTTDGADQTFTTTTPPAVTTGTPSKVTRSSAGLNGTVDPKGQATTYYFRYGTTTSYGLQTSPVNAGSGTDTVAAHATVYGLTANTVYHYQLVAQNAGGISYGADQTVTTTASQAVVMGHEGFVSPGWVVGVELGCFHGTSTCTGQLKMTHNGTEIAQRSYSIAADSGGFQNMVLNSTGRGDLGQNSTFHLLPVTVTATSSTGQTLSFVIHLARWVWH
ncbi:MAG TPA: fibronectin type III domain-containing protein [Solirubrobacteraceae bacterium]|nr:fibronectin type III domain-containing protein [Solirubrobacteraceae bacterium]